MIEYRFPLTPRILFIFDKDFPSCSDIDSNRSMFLCIRVVRDGSRVQHRRYSLFVIIWSDVPFLRLGSCRYMVSVSVQFQFEHAWNIQGSCMTSVLNLQILYFALLITNIPIFQTYGVFVSQLVCWLSLSTRLYRRRTSSHVKARVKPRFAVSLVLLLPTWFY